MRRNCKSDQIPITLLTILSDRSHSVVSFAPVIPSTFKSFFFFFLEPLRMFHYMTHNRILCRVIHNMSVSPMIVGTTYFSNSFFFSPLLFWLHKMKLKINPMASLHVDSRLLVDFLLNKGQQVSLIMNNSLSIFLLISVRQS